MRLVVGLDGGAEVFRLLLYRVSMSAVGGGGVGAADPSS